MSPPASSSALGSQRSSSQRGSPAGARRSANDRSVAAPGKARARKLRSPPQPAKAAPRRALPAVDERLVMPERRFEIIDGRVEEVAPSDEAHGTRHSKVSALLEAYVRADYEVASDMLTRTSNLGDMAPDASVFPAARDAETGGRRLEELAFEVVSTESLGHAATKARELSRRGVRRVFAVDVERRRALEWSRATDTWEILSNDAAIEDGALVTPLSVRALVEAMKADDAVAAALLAKKNAVIEAALLESRLQGKRETLLTILSARGFEVTKKAEKKIRGESTEARIDAWIRASLAAASVDEVLKK
ncbi:MAG: Uma2 family endonuclease [Polyangiaceae bacterium]